MRTWYKFYLENDPGSGGQSTDKTSARDATFADHAAEMGGYGGGAGYGSREEFFKTYYHSYQLGRIENYENFVRKCLKNEDKVLSLAAGRGALELLLGQENYDITISDLEPVEPERTKALFPYYKFVTLDVLRDPVPAGYDVVLCLSLMHLFDERELGIFLGNVARNIAPGARLILDSAGSPPTLISNFLLEKYLRWEIALIKLLKRDRKKSIVKKEFGYRRSDEEIINAAQGAGFRLARKHHGGELMELRRSSIFNKIVKEGSPLEELFRPLGKTMPYTRLFEFIKI